MPQSGQTLPRTLASKQELRAPDCPLELTVHKCSFEHSATNIEKFKSHIKLF
jgi:hypothetical protein